MKRKTINTCSILSVILLSITLVSCNKSTKSGVSSKTGMAYNNKYNGGFQVAGKVKRGPGPGLIAIEGGTFVMGGSSNQDLVYENDNTKRRVTVASFYMDETEVSNVDWLEYLYWIKRNFKDDAEYYYNALPDTLVWRRPLSYNEPYVNNYLRHPAFQDYPVVGVTWEQARDYCVWRSDRVNEDLLRKGGYLAAYKGAPAKGAAGAAASSVPDSIKPFNTDIYLNGQYRGQGIDGKKMKKDLNPNATATAPTAGTAPAKGGVTRPIRLEDGLLKEPYRLPTEAEWEYAALALAGNTSYENIENGKIYPWNGMGVRSAKKKTRGLIMANFKRGNGDNMGTGGWLNDKADITAPVKSFQPNDFGLYNMAGNVNEWTADVYRKLSFEEFEEFNPYRGNEYVDKALADKQKGTYKKDKHGRVETVSSITAKKQTWQELQAGVKPDSTFKADKRSVDQMGVDDNAKELYGVSSLVNEKSRVYKGGSWNDRAFWLNPATRRYMQQDEASAEIGFRCAMTLVGSPEVSSKSGKPQFRTNK
ncbi:MAG: SUMF1/EgtB/PvdO family nonheme iron enzyme [Sphingobacteriaceae bacterium]